MQRSDVIIIGGGLIGACCADALTERGLDVTLLERRFPASGSSRACDGLILLWDKKPGAELELGRRSVERWKDLVPRLGTQIDFRKSGTLLVNDDQSGFESTRRLLETLIAEGISANLLEPTELTELEPGLAHDLAGGAYFPDDYQVDPRRATLAIMRKARTQGLRLHNGEEVQILKRPRGSNNGWQVITQRESYEADRVVCCAGVWSAELLRPISIDIPIRPRKGHILVIKTGIDLLHHPVLEGGYEETVHAGGEELQTALVAEATPAGTMLIGSSRQFAGFDTRVSWEVLEALARRATRFIPAVGKASLIRSYAGLRPWSPDHLPLIGPVNEADDLYLASGHEGAGICLAPVTADLITAWILDGEPPEFADAVTPRRFL